MIPGSVQWLEAFRSGAFSNRPPIPWSPPPKHVPARILRRQRQLAKPLPLVKAPRTASWRVAVGRSCPYCGRVMKAGDSSRPTRDHVEPRSKGGRLTVWACWSCNNCKGDMSFNDWKQFMASNNRWWESRKISSNARNMF